MGTTISLDDDLIVAAQEYTGIRAKSAFVREALTALIQRKTARWLALLGGSAPEFKAPPRRRSAAVD